MLKNNLNENEINRDKINMNIERKRQEKRKNTNNKNDLSKKEKRDILIYSLIVIFGMLAIVLVIYLLISNITKRRNEAKLKYEKNKYKLENMNDRNMYINKRNISEEELYKTDYNQNAEFQMAPPNIGDYILELKFTGFDPIKFKIFLPNAPKLGLDLEEAVKNKKLIGKKVNMIASERKIYVNGENSEKIWTVHSRDNLDLKLLPFYGSLVVVTDKKYADENYGGEFRIITSKEDVSEILKKRKYPEEIIKLSEKYGGTIQEDYPNHSVIGQIIEGEETIKIMQERINEIVEDGREDKEEIIIEDAKFYTFKK